MQFPQFLFAVFQKHHSALFTPDPPSKQKSVLMNSGIFMANLSHVLIQFPNAWRVISCKLHDGRSHRVHLFAVGL